MQTSGYFDNNATTPLDPRAREAMLPWLGEHWGNPSSAHRFGRLAHEAIEEARDQVAALLGARPVEIVFTATGSEANNTVLESSCPLQGTAGHLVLSALEHPSVARAAGRLESRGVRVTTVPPEADGVVSADRFTAELTPQTSLACLMLANNEIGTLQPVARVARRCRELGVPLLCDAVQAAGKIRVDVGEIGADFVVIGAHKFHGPLGAAALWVRPGRDLSPLVVGGSQERRRRAGTSDVASLVGFGTACESARRELDRRATYLAALRDRLEEGLSRIPGAVVHCRRSPRLPNTSHVAFRGVDGSDLMMRLDLAGYAVSTGSACSSGAIETSPTLAAMGLDEDEARASLRISLGMRNTAEEVDGLLAAVLRELGALRGAA